jgi:7-methylguanosine nucleotidase
MKENIIVVDESKFEKIKKKILEDGIEKFHVLADFDRTLTKCFVGDKKSSTSWAQFRNLSLLGEDYIKKSGEMFEYYRPIEIDSNLSRTEKAEKMNEWWERHLELLVQSGVSENILKEVIEKGGIELREGAKEFLNFLKDKKIPLIIMSSGLGDLIEGVLERDGVKFENINVISNFFEFDEEGKSVGFKEDVIHAMNKYETEIKVLPIFRGIEVRKNVLLLGDNIEDVGMIEGFDFDNLIKIGFLNENVEENLELFKKSYDVIILGDGDMNFVNEFLEGMK